MKCNVENKIRFIKSLSPVITTFKTGIKSIEYVVFKHSEKGWTQEYLVVNYDGGAKTVRNCNGDSFSAVFEELSRFLDSGYYDEVEDIKHYENSPNWKRIDLEIN